MQDGIITHPLMEEMLHHLETVLRSYNVDFYLVGAVARDIHLYESPYSTVSRKTRDIDIAVMLNDEEQFYTVKEALLEAGLFTEHRTEAIKIFYKDELEIDLLPFGEIENIYGEVQLHKPRVFTIDMPAFSEVYRKVEEKKIGNTSLNVCSMDGLIILKLIANDDNSSRNKDLADIEQLIGVYFDIYQDEIFTDYYDVMDLYETEDITYMQLISARIIGRKMKAILAGNEKLCNRVNNILGKRIDTLWQALQDGLND